MKFFVILFLFLSSLAHVGALSVSEGDVSKIVIKGFPQKELIVINGGAKSVRKGSLFFNA